MASVCSIFALVAGVSLDATMKEITSDITYNVDYSRWFVAIIVFASIILFVAVIGLLFSNMLNKNVKSMEVVALVVAGLVCISVLIILGYMTCDNSSFIYDTIVDGVHGLEGTDVKEIEDVLCACSNILYRNSMVLILVSSLFALGIPVTCFIYSARTEVDDVEQNIEEGDEVRKTNIETDVNSIIKSEIEKLKKQLELEELKEEYKSLYLKLNATKLDKTTESTKEE